MAVKKGVGVHGGIQLGGNGEGEESEECSL